MKRALILICLLCLMFSPCTGETPLETKAVPGEAQFSRGYEAAREMADGVIGLRLMQSGCTYESWAGEALLKSAGAEWYVITLIQLGRPVSVAGSLAYLDAILEEPRVRSASERLKYALTYCALGVNDSEYIKTTADECPGAQGVMSYIYGLHLLNNGVLSDRFTAEKLAEELLALR